jgi:pyruvate dehydrogenase E2 component (dihydrolipoamide acetyltransferase)
MLRRNVFRGLVSKSATSMRFLTITPVYMPSLSPTMEQGKVTEWSLKVGDKISGGETYCKIETDKAVVGFDNVADEGFIAKLLVEAPSDSVKVGTPVILLVDEQAGVNSPEVANWKPEAATATAAPEAAAAAAPAAAAAAAPAAAATSGSRVFASPLAKVTAAKLGVTLSTVVGTGGAVGRVTKSDVEAAAKAGPTSVPVTAPAAAAAPSVAAPVAASAPKPSPKAAAPAVVGGDYEDTPVTSMRATIAKRLTQSKNVEVPHYYLFNECKADNMLSVIKQLNAKGGGSFKISVNDYIVKAVARANLIVPVCNSSWQGDFIRQYKGVDVSVAVATPTGLITPIIKNAHAKGLAEISQETKALAKKAREGTLQPAEFIGGTVSVSNLGASGIPSFTAIINPPQAMILAVGTTVPKPEISKNEEGEFVLTGKVEQTISFTASFDHRVVDGAIGAEWFKHFKDAIENPLSLLL